MVRKKTQKLTNRKAALQIVESLEKRFKATDYPPGQIVIAKPIDDMGLLVFDNAFAQFFDEYYLVFPEHHEPQVFHKDEYDVAIYSRKEVPGVEFTEFDKELIADIFK